MWLSIFCIFLRAGNSGFVPWWCCGEYYTWILCLASPLCMCIGILFFVCFSMLFWATCFLPSSPLWLGSIILQCLSLSLLVSIPVPSQLSHEMYFSLPQWSISLLADHVELRSPGFCGGNYVSSKDRALIIIEDHFALPVISQSSGSVCPHLALIIPSFLRSVPSFFSLCCLKPSLLCIIIPRYLYSSTILIFPVCECPFIIISHHLLFVFPLVFLVILSSFITIIPDLSESHFFFNFGYSCLYLFF